MQIIAKTKNEREMERASARKTFRFAP